MEDKELLIIREERPEWMKILSEIVQRKPEILN